MSYCGICGRHHSPTTPCAVANRPAGRKATKNTNEGKFLARKVDWILGTIALLVVAYAIYYMAVQ